jgi:hypothetical protein
MNATRTSMRELVTIGQVWTRKRDGKAFTVRQVWRTDRLARMLEVSPTFETTTVSLSDLRRLWRLER